MTNDYWLAIGAVICILALTITNQKFDAVWRAVFPFVGLICLMCWVPIGGTFWSVHDWQEAVATVCSFVFASLLLSLLARRGSAEAWRFICETEEFKHNVGYYLVLLSPFGLLVTIPLCLMAVTRIVVSNIVLVSTVACVATAPQAGVPWWLGAIIGAFAGALLGGMLKKMRVNLPQLE